MKATIFLLATALLATGGIAAYTGQFSTNSAPVPVVDEPAFDNYLDAPQTDGTWSYVEEPGESLGLFGVGNPVHPFVIRCDKQSRRVGLARRTTPSGPLTMEVQAETVKRQLVAEKVPNYDMVAADLDPNDPLLDAIAITKGRFAVGVEGENTLYIPAWAEVTRVIEDCR